MSISDISGERMEAARCPKNNPVARPETNRQLPTRRINAGMQKEPGKSTVNSGTMLNVRAGKYWEPAMISFEPNLQRIVPKTSPKNSKSYFGAERCSP